MRRLFERWIRRRHLDSDLREEIDAHLRMRAEMNLSEGMSEHEAKRAAHRQFGNRTRVREETRAVYVNARLEAVARDIRYSLRSLGRRPGSAVVAVLTLGLGIAAATTMFTVVQGILLNPLPFDESQELVWVWSVSDDGVAQRVSYPDFADWRAESRALELVGWGGNTMTLTGVPTPERLTGALFMGDLFRLLGVEPMLGSIERLDEVGPEEPRVVIGHALWQRSLGSDPDVVGRSIVLDGTAHTVAGVMPAGFHFPVQSSPPVDLWVPLARFNPALERQRDARLIEVIGRLRDGLDLERAQAEMDVIATHLSDEYPATNRGLGVRLVPAIDEVTGPVARGIWTLFAASGALLLIAWVNVAGLLLVRASVRRREFAVRTALGASRSRLGRQLLMEGALMSLAGGGCGCLLAYLGVQALVTIVPADLPRAGEIALDPTVLGFALLASSLTAILVSLAPVWHINRGPTTDSFPRSGTDASEGLAGHRLRAVLVVSQIALATLLLTGSGLFMNSLWRLHRPDPGFDPDHVLTFAITWPSEKYPRPAEAFRELRRRLLDIPGVRAASTGLQLPDRGTPMIDDVSPFVSEIDGLPVAAGQQKRTMLLSTQSGYLDAMAIPLLRGRDFVEEDGTGGRRVAIVSESWVRAYMGGEDPIGRRFRLSSWTLSGDSAEIVGVAGDVKHRGVTEAQPWVYLPIEQYPRWESRMILRTEGDPLAYVQAVREAVGSIDRAQPIDELQTLEQRISQSLAADRLQTLLLGAFSTVAVALAGIGLYSALSFVVARRTREVGIRMALGADRRTVRMLVLGRGLRLAAAGIVIGMVAAAALTRWTASLLFGITATDPPTFLAVAMVLIVVAVTACWIPVRHATRIDPAAAVVFD